jgi:hypothetical protein
VAVTPVMSWNYMTSAPTVPTAPVEAFPLTDVVLVTPTE